MSGSTTPLQVVEFEHLAEYASIGGSGATWMVETAVSLPGWDASAPVRPRVRCWSTATLRNRQWWSLARVRLGDLVGEISLAPGEVRQVVTQRFVRDLIRSSRESTVTFESASRETQQSRDAVSVAQASAKTFNWSVNAQGGVSGVGWNASAAAQVGGTSSSQLSRSTESVREATRESSRKLTTQTKFTLTNERETSFGVTSTQTLRNPSDSATLRVFCYELVKEYRVVTSPVAVEPLLAVQFELPAPDRAFVRRNRRFLESALLDDALRGEALNRAVAAASAAEVVAPPVVPASASTMLASPGVDVEAVEHFLFADVPYSHVFAGLADDDMGIFTQSGGGSANHYTRKSHVWGYNPSGKVIDRLPYVLDTLPANMSRLSPLRYALMWEWHLASNKGSRGLQAFWMWSYLYLLYHAWIDRVRHDTSVGQGRQAEATKLSSFADKGSYAQDTLSDSGVDGFLHPNDIPEADVAFYAKNRIALISQLVTLSKEAAFTATETDMLSPSNLMRRLSILPNVAAAAGIAGSDASEIPVADDAFDSTAAEDAASLQALLDHLSAYWEHYQASYLRFLRDTVGDGPLVEACNDCVAQVFDLENATYGLPVDVIGANADALHLQTLRTTSRGRPLLGLFDNSRLDVLDRTVLVPLAPDLPAKLQLAGVSSKAGRVHALLELRAQVAALDVGAKVGGSLAKPAITAGAVVKSAGEVGAMVDAMLVALAPGAQLGLDPEVAKAKAKAQLEGEQGNKGAKASAASGQGAAPTSAGSAGGSGAFSAQAKPSVEPPSAASKHLDPKGPFDWLAAAATAQRAAVESMAGAVRAWAANAVLVDDDIALPMDTVHYESSFASCDGEGKGG